MGYRIYDSKPIPKEVRAAYNQLIKELLSIGIHREWQLENTVIHFSDEHIKQAKSFLMRLKRRYQRIMRKLRLGRKISWADYENSGFASCDKA